MPPDPDLRKGRPSRPTITTADGWPLHAEVRAGNQARGVLVLSHGVGEHLGCYAQVLDDLAARAGLVDVLAFDYRGHGRSPGRRGVVRRHEDYLRDLEAALDWAGKEWAGRPRYVLGHSNGGLVALLAVLAGTIPLDGLILSNPALAVAGPVPGWKVAFGHALRRVAPWVTLPTGLDDALMTRDEASWPARRADPLRHMRIGPELYFGMITAGQAVAARAGEVRVPTLLLLGEADPVIAPDASRLFFERLGAVDRTLRTYPEMRHELLAEIGREAVLEDIAAWLAERLNRDAGPMVPLDTSTLS